MGGAVVHGSGERDSSTGAAGLGPVSVSGLSDGLRITLTIDRHSYPGRALINARVRIHNVSGRLITAPGTSCSEMNPWVESIGPHGEVVYPDGVKWLNLIPCNGSTTEDTYMGPGYNRTYTGRYVIAGSSTLRAVMEVREPNSLATSPPLSIHLTAYYPPMARIRTRPTVSAWIRPRFRVHSELTYLSVDHCYRGTAPYDYLGVYWAVPGIRVIRPECPHPLSWRVIAGWRDHSVVFINYLARGRVRAPSPGIMGQIVPPTRLLPRPTRACRGHVACRPPS